MWSLESPKEPFQPFIVTKLQTSKEESPSEKSSKRQKKLIISHGLQQHHLELLVLSFKWSVTQNYAKNICDSIDLLQL